MVAMNILFCALCVSIYSTVTAWNMNDKLLKVSNASICHGISTLKTLMSIPNQAHDAFNVLASTACLLKGYGEADSLKLFKAFKFNVAFDQVSEVFDVFNELNLQKLYSATSLYLIQEKFKIKNPFEIFMEAFQYATLKPDATFQTELKEGSEVRQFLTNKNIDPIVSNKFIEHLQLFANDTMVYINGARFSKSFKVPFKVENTESGEFLNHGTTKATAMFMKGTIDAKHAETTDYTALELLLEKDDRMLFILPKQADGLEQLLKTICHDDVWKIINSMERKKVDVKIPKFRVTTEKTIESYRADADIKHLLSANADMSNIADGLHFSQLYMLTSVELNETGIHYQAVSGSVTGTGRTLDDIPSFHCVHPFIYLVLSKKENILILAGFINEL